MELKCKKIGKHSVCYCQRKDGKCNKQIIKDMKTTPQEEHPMYVKDYNQLPRLQETMEERFDVQFGGITYPFNSEENKIRKQLIGELKPFIKSELEKARQEERGLLINKICEPCKKLVESVK